MTPLPRSWQSRVQQFEAFAQGLPSWTQPPFGCMQRPGAPPTELHRPEQQSSGFVQTSPYALHAPYAGTHRASWQFQEQHWIPLEQLSPSVPQVPPAIVWHVPELVVVPLQMPEQHWASLVQAVVEGVPSGFTDEVHSTFVAQRPPRDEVASAEQIPVQHSFGVAGSHSWPP